MTVGYGSTGTVGIGSTSVTPGLPGSLANTNGVLIHVMTKPDTATINTPSGWTLIADVAGGGGTTGSAVGPTRQAVFFREKDATWSTMPTISVTGGSASAAIASRWTKDPTATWVTPTASTGAYGTAGTTTNGACTTGSNPAFAAGDMAAVGYSSMSVTPTWSAESLSATGATFGTNTERSDAIETTTGNDVGGMMFTSVCTAGASTAAPVTAATASAATRGTVTVVRMREQLPPPFDTHPDALAISPPVVKVNNATSVVSSAAFTVPANVRIVVGITSDSNDASQAAPVCDDAGADVITYTQMAARGYGSLGHDVGLVGLWVSQKITSSQSTTVRVTTNITSTKPKMLIVKVYDADAIDLDDPIGTVLSGSFAASSSSISVNITPETTGGGLRGLWLDWNATGIPTAFLPNNTDTGLVDGYHNATLSTNMQVGKSTATAAGVAETIGATLLSASSDGNYIFYELRAPVASGPVTVTPTGVGSAQAFGTLTASTILGTVPTGIASAQAFGTLTATVIPPATTVTTVGIASAENVNSNLFILLSPLVVAPTAIGSAQAMGAPSVTTQLTVTTTAIASAGAFGTPTVTVIPPSQTATAVGIASGQAIGSPSVSTVLTATTIGISSSGAFGLPTVSTVLTATPSGVLSGQAFGAPTLTTLLGVAPSGIASASAFGTPTITGGLSASPTGIASGQAFGLPTVTLVGGGAVTASPSGIVSAEVVGSPLVSSQVTVGSIGIPSAQAFGTPTALEVITVAATGIASGQALGTPSVSTKLTSTPLSIASLGAFGIPTVLVDIDVTVPGIGSAQALGEPTLMLMLLEAFPNGIPSEQAFGDVYIGRGYAPAAVAVASFTGSVSKASLLPNGATAAIDDDGFDARID